MRRGKSEVRRWRIRIEAGESEVRRRRIRTEEEGTCKAHFICSLHEQLEDLLDECNCEPISSLKYSIKSLLV